MRLHVILRNMGFVLLLNSVFLMIAGIISIVNHETSAFPLFYSSLVALLFGLFPLVFAPPVKDISNKEGLTIVVSSWLISCLIGMLPYILWGGPFTITNAWFESVSGYTTTGSSILSDIEILPRGLLFWRSLTHWIGGMGIVIFVLAILPYMGIAGMVLYRSEVSHHTQEKLRFRTRKAAQILLSIYIGLTLVQTLLMMLGGMGILDALAHSFATIATGGFSTKNASIAYFNSVYIEIVTIVFMILSGIHFGLLYTSVKSGIGNLFRSSIVRVYLGLMLVGTVLVAGQLVEHLDLVWPTAFRQAAFQITSIGTSTGFATADSNFWPPLAKVIIIFFTLQCACAGSTSGGIKVERIILFGKTIGKKMKEILHPHAIINVKIDEKVIDPSVLEMGVLYVSVYLLFVFVSTLLLTAMNVDPMSAFSGSAACMGNVGPGFGIVGSVANFGPLPAAGKWVLSFIMLFGRLEIFGLVIFLSPDTWKSWR